MSGNPLDGDTDENDQNGSRDHEDGSDQSDDPLDTSSEGPDDESETESTSTLEEYGEAGLETVSGTIGTWIALGLQWIGDRLVKNTLGLIWAISKIAPVIGERFWAKLAKRTLYLYHKRAGGDAIGIEQLTQEKAEFTPVKYKPAEKTDKDERPGWSAKGRDKTWKPTSFGRSTMRIGKAPIVPLDNDNWRSTSFAEARVAEAIDQGDMRPLYRVDEADLEATIEMGSGSNGAAKARADGGATITDRSFNPRTTPIFEDMIIDLGSDDYDGQALSFWKSKELMYEQTTTDEMKRQEQRGFLAGKSQHDLKSLVLKIMIIGGLIALGGLIGPELVAALLGGGGGGSGGGGGMLPFMISVVG